MPNLNDCKFKVFEFFTFLLRRSSLKSFAFSTKKNISIAREELILTVSSFSGIMAPSIKNVSIELIFK